jgi:hypothetical protein
LAFSFSFARLAFGALSFFGIGLELVEQGIESQKVFLPESAVPFEPGFQLLKRRRPQPIDPALRVYPNVDQTCVTEHSQMLGDLGLAQAELLDQVANRPRPLSKNSTMGPLLEILPPRTREPFLLPQQESNRSPKIFLTRAINP